MIARTARTLHRAYHGIMSRLRNQLYRALGVTIDGYVWMRAIEIPRQWEDIIIERGAALDRGVLLLASGPARTGKLRIGAGTYVNRYTIFDAHQQLEIGRDCMIGPHCYFTDADHGKEAGVAVKLQPMRPAPVIIEDEVWIGAGAVVLPGVRIGRGAVIGARAVVTRDVPAEAIVVGAPARVVRMRGAVVS